MSTLSRIFAVSTLTAVAFAAQAASLTGTGTADDAFHVYLTTDLTSPGTAVWSKNTTWSDTNEGTSPTISLTPGQSVWLLVDADNFNGGPAMFVADFQISGGGFLFSNGSTSLSTNTTNWTVNETSFSDPASTPYSMGLNVSGLQIWGPRPGISDGAEAIWAYNADWTNGHSGHAYFATQITAVPEPETYAMLLAGLGALGFMGRRRSSKAAKA